MRRASVNVLIIDDDQEFVRDLVEAWPTEGSEEVMSAASAREAIQMLQSFRPDAVVLDLTMPSWLASDAAREGLALLGALTARHLGELPVIVATDCEDEELLTWCRRLGAREVLLKSAGLDPIYQAIEKALAGTAANRKEEATCADGETGQLNARDRQEDPAERREPG
jgi:DNA-binding NarL/FixJ family response regulator